MKKSYQLSFIQIYTEYPEKKQKIPVNGIGFSKPNFDVQIKCDMYKAQRFGINQHA